MKKQIKRGLSLLLACCMCLSLLPGQVLAEETKIDEKEQTMTAAPSGPSEGSDGPKDRLPDIELFGGETELANAALGKTASSNRSGGLSPNSPPSLAVDGDTSADSRWTYETGKSADMANTYLQVDLGTDYEIHSLRVLWEDQSAYTVGYTIATSPTGEEDSWTTLVTKARADWAVDQALVLDQPVNARYVRLTCTEHNGYGAISIREFEVMAPEDPPVPPIDAPSGTNLARGKTATASSQEANSVRPALAVDGNTTAANSRWGSNRAKTTGSHSAWLKVDLGEVYNVQRFRIFWERLTVKSHSIQISRTGVDGTWEDVYTEDTLIETLNESVTLDAPKAARYVRLNIAEYLDQDEAQMTVEYDTVSLYEFEIYPDDEALYNEVPKGTSFFDPQAPDRTFGDFIGADYEQIIGADKTVYQPIVDTWVTVSMEVTPDGGAKSVQDIPVLVKGDVATNTGNSAPEVIPELREWVGGSGNFSITGDSKIVVNAAHYAALQKTVDEFAADYRAITGKTPAIEEGTAPGTGDFYFTLGSSDAGLGKEGYRLTIADGVSVEALETTGAYWATRTILQILKQNGTTIPKGQTRDYPKFEVRTLIMDVGRKPFDEQFLEDLLKNMTWYKMNDINLHLSDNYIWLEKYTNAGEDPMTAYSGFRLQSSIVGENGHALTSTDEYYTKDWMRQFILKAREVGVNIVPEFDTPAHSLALTQTRPELKKGSDGRENDHLNLANADAVDASAAFTQSIWDEYITQENPVFDMDTTLNVGTDEYSGANEGFRSYMDKMFEYVQDTGRTVRAWGSLTSAPGSTPVRAENVQLNMWFPGYADPKAMYDLGYGLISTRDNPMYIVPGASYYNNYINTEARYRDWTPYDSFNGIPVGSPQVLGGGFACWNDLVDKSANGLSTVDVYDRIADALPTVAEKTWGEGAAKTYDQLRTLQGTLGDAPNSNPRMDIESKSNTIAAYDFTDERDLSGNGYDLGTLHNAVLAADGQYGNALKLNGGVSSADLPIGTVGPNSIECWVKQDADAAGDQVLFESGKGSIKVYADGKLGFTREEYGTLYDGYTFGNYTLPKGEWVKLRFSSALGTAKLYVNDELKSTLSGKTSGGDPMPATDWYATMYLPLDRIGSGTNAFKGMIDRVVAYKGTGVAPNIWDNPDVSGITVTFDSNGGSAVAPVQAAQGGTVAKPADPTRAGYTFGGWYTTFVPVAAWDFAKDTVTEARTLYARWIKGDDADAPAAWGPTPTDAQLAYHREEMAAFVHFGPNTFKNQEWGDGQETVDDFNPTNMTQEGVNAWVRELKDAGFKRVMMVGKHHDGFCMWDSAYTEFDVTNSPFKKDVMEMVSIACTEADMGMGFYISPWDMHETSYGTGEAYNEYYNNQLIEVLSNPKYGNNGKFAEVWMDGAKGSGAVQEYDFDRWFDTIHKYQPDCLIYTDRADGGIRWSGNERGMAGDPSWQRMNAGRVFDNDSQTWLENGLIPWKTAAERTHGASDGTLWSVCECDVSLRPGWFYHADQTPKTIEALSDIYFNSVALGSVLLLNVPPDKTGNFSSADSARLGEFGRAITQTYDEDFIRKSGVTAAASAVRGDTGKFTADKAIDGDSETYWTMDDGQTTGSLTIDLGQARTFDMVSIGEYIALGQRISGFEVEYRTGDSGDWKEFATGTTIGQRRLVRHSPVTADQLKISITASQAVPLISDVGVFKMAAAFELKSTIPEGLTYKDDRAFTTSGSVSSYDNEDGINNTHTGTGTAGTTFTSTFTGSLFCVMGIVDPGHGKFKVTIDGDSANAVTVDTNATARKAKQVLYTSPTLPQGEHTVVLECLESPKTYFDFDGIYYLDNGGKGMFEIAKATYIVGKNDTVDVAVRRVGGSTGEVAVKINTLPGTAVQGQYYEEVSDTLTFSDGVTEQMVTLQTKETAVSDDMYFFLAISEPTDGALIGFRPKTTVTISAQPVIHEQTPKGETFTEQDPFILPAKLGASGKLEAEYSILQPGADVGDKYVRINEGPGADNKHIGWFEPGNSILIPFTAAAAGDYTVTVRVESGRAAGNLNTLNWRGGTVEAGTAEVPSTIVSGDTTEYRDMQIELTVTRAGAGALEFYADSHASPNIDSFTFQLTSMPCTVSFNTNGGTAVDPIETRTGAKIARPADPAKDGFVLEGWYSDAAFTQPWDFEAGTVEGDMTLHAKWSAPIVVSFESNGGTPVESVRVAQGAKLTQPAAPEKEGFLLEGWYKDSALEERWNFASDTVTSSLTLYAKWVEYVPSDSVRTTLFNDGWRFQLSAAGTPQNTDYDDSAWRGLTLPHDWSIEQDFSYQASSEIGHLTGGTGWYRKHFTLPADMAGKRINLDFNGVYMDSYLYVNGQLVGNYPNGYLPFSFDVTDYVVCDGVTENVVAVKVTNITSQGQQSSRWYSGSGIYRDVSLTVTEPVHVAQYGTAFRTPELAAQHGGTVDLEAATTIRNDGSEAVSALVRTTLLDYYSGAVAGAPALSAAVTVPAHGRADAQQTIPVVQPRLWSPEDPNLYNIRTEILVDGVVTDTYVTRFGFKWAVFDKDNGFSLNGDWTKLSGVCMHHDQGALGAVDNAAAILRQMQRMKDMGVNSIRVTHNPASPTLMRICDELGLMVIEEAFDTWYGGKNANDYGRFFEAKCTYPSVADQNITWAQFDLQQMISSNRNSPSVIMWSLGNEIGETNQAKGLTTVRNLVSWAKEIDTDHPVTMGEDKFRMGRNDSSSYFVQVADELDVVGMNYAEANYDWYRERHPNWIIYGAETSSAIKSRGYYSDPNKTTGASNSTDYQLSSYDNLAVGWGSTATNSWIPDRDRKYVQGQFIWTGFDYIGEPTPWNQSFSAPPKSSYFGIVDTAGIPKDDYYLYQSQWLDVDTKPIVHIFPHWNWEDAALRSKVTVDGKIPLRVYSNAPKVELLVDGVSQGVKSFTQKTTGYGTSYQQQSADSDRLYLEWPLAWEYAVGKTITAKALDANGNELASDAVITAGAPAKLSAKAERSVISADGLDLAYIELDVLDAAGSLVPTAMNGMNFQISGTGRIVGVDNGDAASWERYKDTDGAWSRSAFNGKAMVIVQSTGETGSFTLTATGAGLESSSVTVYTKGAGVSDDTVLGYENISMTTDVGVQPTLPARVNAVLAGGGKVEKDVTWDTVTEAMLAQPGILTLNGAVEGGGRAALTLTVRGVTGVKETSLVTSVGVIPTLPSTVTVVWSDGTSEQRGAVWPAIVPEQVAAAGSFTVSGTVDGYPGLTATVRIRVTDETTLVNVAQSANGTTVEASYSEGVHVPGQAIDGVVNSTTGEANGWGNWNNPSRKDDSLTLTFPQEYTVSSARVWIENNLSPKTWQRPDTIIIQYWDGAAFVDVPNQSKTGGFTGRTSLSDTAYAGEAIDFDPITTSKIKFNFHVDSYTGTGNMMKIAETAVYSSMVVGSSDAALSGLTVNGASLEGFDPDTLGYVYAVPYLDDVPRIAATPRDPNATVFIRQALSSSDAAHIEVTSEDGTATQNYTVQFTRQAPKLSEVTIRPLGTVTEDDVITLFASGLMEDGTAAPDGAAVTWTVADGTGHAAVTGGKLYAYDQGSVTLTASMTWQGVTVESDPLAVDIQENDADKQIVSFDPVSVKTSPGVAPALPDTVTANYNTGLPRALPVRWEGVDPGQYAALGRFTVAGTVDGTDLRPQATVEVVDLLAAAHISMAVPVGYRPELPQTVTCYFSDGATDLLPVSWPETIDPVTAGTVTINGTVAFAGKSHPVTATVRAADATRSPNYAILRNGYDLPVGIAQYTNDKLIDSYSNDSAAYLNDGNVSFDMTESKRVWSDWIRDDKKTTNWVSAILAAEGIKVERTVDTVRVGFLDEGGSGAGGLKVPQSYTVEYYTGPIDYTVELAKQGHVAQWTDSPLNESANWTEVTYVGGKPPVPASADFAQLLEVKFEPVKTNLVRVNMSAYTGYSLGVNEIEVYGSIPTANTTVSGQKISVGGTDRTGDFKNGVLSIELLTGAPIPAVTAQAADNAAVTVVPATEQRPTATVYIVPEDGGQTAARTYTIHFTWSGQAEDTQAPTMPGDVRASAVDHQSATITWKASTDDSGVIAAYVVTLKKGDTVIKTETTTATTIRFTGLTEQTAYAASVVARDAAGNTSPEGKTSFTTAAASSGGGTSGGGSGSQSTVDDSGNKITTVVNKQTGDATYTVTAPDGTTSKTVVKDGQITSTVTVSRKAHDSALDGETLELPLAGVAVSADSAPVVEITLPKADKTIYVLIPADGLTAGSVAVLVNTDGTKTVVRQSVVVDGKLRLPLNGSATFRIEDRAPSFADVPLAGWMADPIAFVSSRELMSGDGASFVPTALMTRAMLATVLYRFAGEPKAERSAFADVPADSYYADAVAWAAENGVVTGGTDGGFLPDGSITREQLAAMLYRFAGSPKDGGVALDKYADAGEVSPWAHEAMLWAVGSGILTGKSGSTLDPGGSATRVEVAAMLLRFAAYNR